MAYQNEFEQHGAAVYFAGAVFISDMMQDEHEMLAGVRKRV